MPSDTALHMAAKAGEVDEATKILDAYADKVKEGAARDTTPVIDEQDCTGWTPLHWAASRARDDVARLLIDRNANVHLVTADNWAAAHDAARKGSEPVLRMLRDATADLKIRTSNGNTPLHLACQYGKVEAATFLADCEDVNLNEANNLGHTPLHVASRYGHEAIVALLIDKRGSVLLQDRISRTAQILAKEGKFEGVVTLLEQASEEQRNNVINAAELGLNAGAEALSQGDKVLAKEKYEEAEANFIIAGEEERALKARELVNELKKA
eukprot:CAMPEP_0173379990 /NCGR_PEP_ID=MMETSP1356-20130122/2782_1 /TAXON_ID=77927 ORGANISM="Hemiselmis virescens, Strain PCC157" /NCGR_SAMPLE_ID=MMETSP1356 /ASSEMBLY_ACC=CAM_ASM_000847 /LENGTH=268 /DNA_ID=CAMNT_0014333461 /DNA_START=120 /DNA_END=926 /DNA_ORIENTATION=-